MKPPVGRCSRSGLCSQGTDAAADAAKHPAAQPRLRPGRSGCCGCEQPAPAAADAAAAAGLMESSALLKNNWPHLMPGPMTTTRCSRYT